MKSGCLTVGATVSLAIALCQVPARSLDSFDRVYADNCAVCHGADLQGAAQGPPLVGGPLLYGDSVAELSVSIADGYPARAMPGFADTLSTNEIRRLAILIAEKRAGLESQSDFRMANELIIPDGLITTDLTPFKLEIVATGIDPYAFSIAPLPDGDILVTEKERGLSIISADGSTSNLIEGTPDTSDKGRVRWGLNYGLGWHLDVAPHPDYETNGWIYLHHGHLRNFLFVETSMNRLVRGRIKDGTWVDQEVIWSAPEKFYNVNGDLSAGGRIAFDRDGHVFVSVGNKAVNRKVQDLATPYGKILRIRDDGSIPDDNPFANREDVLPGIWTYGHRNPQGLEFDVATGTLWNSEMGPRGGDEINLLVPGGNYGWPLYSKGLNYNGSPVDGWKEAGLMFDDIIQPVVDMTPSPAVSSFIIYDGDAFPMWRGDFIVGSLKGTALYRVIIRDGAHTGTEVLLDDLARIRDVETGNDGFIYLLLEHESGSQIVRLVPADQ